MIRRDGHPDAPLRRHQLQVFQRRPLVREASRPGAEADYENGAGGRAAHRPHPEVAEGKPAEVEAADVAAVGLRHE